MDDDYNHGQSFVAKAKNVSDDGKTVIELLLNYKGNDSYS